MKSAIKFAFIHLFFLFQFIPSQAQNVVINEILASNSQGLVTVFGEHSDWIELYNPGCSNANLTGYFLTDENDSLTKWKFPANTFLNAGTYLLVYADGQNTGLHTNFKLSKSGEFISLVNPDSTIADSLTFGKQSDDISFGRILSQPENWGYFPIPTPGKINSSSSSSGLLPDPVFSIQGGFFTGTQQLTLSIDADADIYYTLDGTEPTPATNKYTTPLSLTKTTAVRAIAIKAGFISGPVLTNTFFINETTTLPVISLVTNPANLFDDKIGIYVTGTNGIAGACDQTPRNLNQDWERPVNVELYESTGEQGLNQEAGIKIFGGCSRTRYPQKSFALFARNNYGKGSFDYPIFPDRSFKKYESFLLRSSSDDQVFTFFRDALSHSVLPEFMDAEIQAYRPALVFINGVYWGIHNLREKIDEHYFSNHFGVNPDEVNILEGQGWATVGSATSYSAMVTYTDQKNMALKANYDYIKTQMDVDQYIDYMTGHIYLAERDWPGNNIKFWKANSGEFAKLRWINFDMDQCFTLIWLNEDMIAKTTQINGPGWPNPDWSTKLFRNLLKNPDFKNEFIQRYAWHTNVTFNPERLISFIDRFSSRLSPEIPRHIQKWGGKIDPDSKEGWPKPTFNSIEEWQSHVGNMRTFATERATNSNAHIVQKFGLSGASKLTVKSEKEGSGAFQVVNKSVPNGFTGTFFNDIPLKISVVPFHGNTFSHWGISATETQKQDFISSGSTWHYYDKNGLPNVAWMSSGFDESGWASGTSQFGNGEGDESTVISFGPNSQSKYMTAYFRTKFTLEPDATLKTVSLDLIADDGAVIYLNGNEILRVNMPTGPITFSTPALGFSGVENEFVTFSIPAEKFIEGTNVIAAEIHQSGETSSDLSFDLKLSGYLSGGKNETTVYSPELTIVPGGDQTLTAYFSEDSTETELPVVLNEINYQSATDFNTEDWVEIHNSGLNAISLDGWTFSDFTDSTGFIFPEGLVLEPKGFLILCKDTLKFDRLHPTISNRIGNFDFGLSSAGETLFLKDGSGNLVDEVFFGTTSPWPQIGSTGFTLELINPLNDNNLPSAWISSKAESGTPGFTNSQCFPVSVNDRENQLFSLFQNYPNPFNPSTTISYSLPVQGFTELSVYSVIGQKIITLVEEKQEQGLHSVNWNAAGLASGVYLIRLKSGSLVKMNRMILLK